MPDLARVFLALFLAHLLTDFLFQSDALVKAKRSRRVWAYVLHGAIHFVTALCALALFSPASGTLLWRVEIVAVLTVLHLFLDAAKLRLSIGRSREFELLAFLADQCIHLLTILAAALVLVGIPVGMAWIAFAAWLHAHALRILLISVVYVAVMFGGGYFIGMCTDFLLAEIHHPASEETMHAGMFIGWLERFLVLSAMLLASPASVGLILTAKSIARYPQFTKEHFAECFLIGTLLSLSTAVAGGALLLHVLRFAAYAQ